MTREKGDAALRNVHPITLSYIMATWQVWPAWKGACLDIHSAMLFPTANLCYAPDYDPLVLALYTYDFGSLKSALRKCSINARTSDNDGITGLCSNAPKHHNNRDYLLGEALCGLGVLVQASQA